MAVTGYRHVLERVDRACGVAGVDPVTVTLVAVSKTRSDADVLAVHAQGQRIFAENREQGLRARMLSDLPDDISWHFVGPLQSRKAAFVGTHVDLLQSMDRMRLAERWAQRSTVPILIEFNLAGEPQKSGFAPSDADRVIDDLLALGLDVRGVMAIPPFDEDPSAARPWFRSLREIHDRYALRYPGIDTCSMGMSHDLEVAIEEGATMVRVGRAIFAETSGTTH